MQPHLAKASKGSTFLSSSGVNCAKILQCYLVDNDQLQKSTHNAPQHLWDYMIIVNYICIFAKTYWCDLSMHTHTMWRFPGGIIHFWDVPLTIINHPAISSWGTPFCNPPWHKIIALLQAQPPWFARQHWGCPAVEHEKLQKIRSDTQCVLVEDSEFSGFWGLGF